MSNANHQELASMVMRNFKCDDDFFKTIVSDAAKFVLDDLYNLNDKRYYNAMCIAYSKSTIEFTEKPIDGVFDSLSSPIYIGFNDLADSFGIEMIIAHEMAHWIDYYFGKKEKPQIAISK